MWVKGSGSDLATMERGDFTPLRLDEMLAADRARRDERRGHGRPPRALPDRPGGAPLLDRDAAARVRAGRARPPHASRRDQRAGRDARRRAAGGGVLRRRGGVDPLHPAGLHAGQAGRDGGAREPRPQAGRARQARAGGVGRHRRGGLPAHDRGDQPRGRVRQRERRRRAALRGWAPADDGEPRGCCAPCCRRCAAPSPSERAKVLVVDTSPRVWSSCPRARRRSW